MVGGVKMPPPAPPPPTTPPCAELGNEFWRGGVLPRSGDAKGMVEERRLVGRESGKDPRVGSRLIGLRLYAPGDSFRDW